MKLYDHRDEIGEVVAVDDFVGQGKRVRIKWENQEPDYAWSEAGLYEKADIFEILKTVPSFVRARLAMLGEGNPICRVETIENLPSGFAFGFLIDDDLRGREFLIATPGKNLSLCVRVNGTLVPRGSFALADRDGLADEAVRYFYKFYDG